MYKNCSKITAGACSKTLSSQNRGPRFYLWLGTGSHMLQLEVCIPWLRVHMPQLEKKKKTLHAATTDSACHSKD